jgi:hypothetical protein
VNPPRPGEVFEVGSHLLLEEDGWHVDYELKDPRLNGGGPHYLKEGEMELVLSRLGEQSARESVSGSGQEKSERGAEVRSVNKSRREFGTLSQSQLSFALEEEEGQKNYGQPAALKAHQQAIVYTKTTGDDTLMVLVIGKQEAKKYAQQIENAATGSLKLIEALIAEGKTDVARFRLRNFEEKYPDTKAAKKAKELLDTPCGTAGSAIQSRPLFFSPASYGYPGGSLVFLLAFPRAIARAIPSLIRSINTTIGFG